jgi:hypothetical protein
LVSDRQARRAHSALIPERPLCWRREDDNPKGAREMTKQDQPRNKVKPATTGRRRARLAKPQAITESARTTAAATPKRRKPFVF